MTLRVGNHFIQTLAEQRSAEFFHQRFNAPVTHREHIGHRCQVTSNLCRQADVGHEHRHQRFVQLAFFVQLDRWNDDAFLMDFGGTGAPTARHVAAHVHPVAGSGHDCEQLAVTKHGRNDLHVLQMATANVGVVHDPHVTRLEPTVSARQFDHLLHGELHIGQKHRQTVSALGDGLPGRGMKNAISTIVSLRNDRGHGCMDQMQIHFISDLFEAAAYNGQSYGVHHFTFTKRLPLESTTTFIAGSTTVVVSLCSMIAGPSKCIPGARSAR